ncbi:PP2C family protein-serine/threonine phosphatase [Streptomyces mirabilis]
MIRLTDERMVLVVGDVEGHAVESAAVMGQVRTAVAAYASEGHPPATVIDRTARLLTALRTELLVTCCVLALDTADGTTEVALAGHPEPLVLRPDGSTSTLDAPVNVPLGVPAPDAYRGREHPPVAWEGPDAVLERPDRRKRHRPGIQRSGTSRLR